MQSNVDNGLIIFHNNSGLADFVVGRTVMNIEQSTIQRGDYFVVNPLPKITGRPTASFGRRMTMWAGWKHTKRIGGFENVLNLDLT